MVASLSVLTFNCFGAYAPGTSARLHALAGRLNASDYDVVCLQEVQRRRYLNSLLRETVSYPYCSYEPFVRAPKGGLLTLGRLQMVEQHFTLYRERGLWYTPALADWLLHKGVLSSRFDLNGQIVTVFNTHLTANYTGDWGPGNAYAEQEYSQLLQLAEMVQAQPPDAIVIVCGDFNIPRRSWMYEKFITLSGLSDPMAEYLLPTLRVPRLLPGRFAQPIDYALVRSPMKVDLHCQSTMKFREPVTIAGKKAHLSDHDAVELRLTWEQRVEAKPVLNAVG